MLKNQWEKMSRRILGILVCAVSALAVMTPAQAKLAPDIQWETVRTSHFLVHYPTTYHRFAATLVDYLEEAYQALSPDLHWEVKSRIDVVVRSDIDLPNGSSAVFPLNRMEINAVPFSSVSSIGEYDNWIRTLAYHELTHMIANDTTEGVFKVGRVIFGSAAKMNQYQPLWLVEGLAVYEETIRSIYGRGRSSYVDMLLRTSARDGLLDNEDAFLGVTIDRLNDGVPNWPSGQTPYLYGYVMDEMVAEFAGAGAPGLISHESASSVPFFLNSVAERVIRTDYYHLWAQAVERLKKISEDDLALIRRSPISPAKRLSDIGRFTGAPVLSKSESRIYFIRDSYHESTGLSVLDLKTEKIQSLSEWKYGGGTELKMASIGKQLVYSRYQPFEEYKLYSDVFLWIPKRGDLEKGREVRITEGKRAFDPDCSPDFEWNPRLEAITHGAVVYIKNLDDGNHAVATFDGVAEKVLYRGTRFDRFAAPAWGHGDHRDWIAFTAKVNGGNERLIAVNNVSLEVRTLTPLLPLKSLRINEVTPSWTEDGSLLYASSQGGIFNIYKLNKFDLFQKNYAKPTRLTHLETGAIFPIEGRSPQEVFAMLYGSSGFDIASIEASPHLERIPHLLSLHEKLHPAANPPKNDLVPNEDELLVDSPNPTDEHPEGIHEKYSPFPSLLPHYWLPFTQKVTDGWTLGVQTSGFDALERHAYSATVAWDSRANFPVYDVAYQYDGLYPTIQMERRQDNQYLGIFGSSNLVDNTTLSFSYPVDLWTVSFGGTYSQSRFEDQKANSGGIEVRFSHTDLEIHPDAIDASGDKGHRADARVAGYFVGGEQFSTLELRWEQRVPSFFDRHFFRFFGNYANSNNQNLSALYYVGGGEGAIADLQNFLLRGYESGAIYGRKIATLNSEYWLPFKDIFHGRGTLPAFYERAKLKLFVDTGTAEFVNNQNRDFGTIWPVGVGIQILQDVDLFYRFPFTLALGFDWGLVDRLGGEKQIVLGLYSHL